MTVSNNLSIINADMAAHIPLLDQFLALSKIYKITFNRPTSNDYLDPRSSDDDFWLYNPRDTDLTVTAETLTGVGAITIVPNSTVRYPIMDIERLRRR